MKLRMLCTYRWGTAAAVALLAAGCAPDQNTAPSAEEEAPALARGQQGERRHMIELKGAKGADFDNQVRALGGRIRREHKDLGIVSVTGLTEAAAAQLATRTDVAAVAQDKRIQWIPRRDELRLQVRRLDHRARRRPGTDQSGAGFYDFYQWNIRQIKANQAWARTSGGRGATVCVLDTGVDPTHIDLQDKVDLSISRSMVLPEEPTITDLHLHGTFVSALISSNGLGIASVAPDARLCAVKVLDQTGSGTTEDIVAGIKHAVDNGADVINMSLGAYVDTRDPDVRVDNRLFQKAIDYATRKRVLVVASSGNGDEITGIGIDLDRDPRYMLHVPSQLNNVLSVGATAPINQRKFDLLTTYSNYGKTGNDVVAPGGDLVAEGDLEFGRDLIMSACSTTSLIIDCRPETNPDGSVSYFYLLGAGTSFAAPHVAGQAAVLEALFPGNQSAGSLTDCIEETADNVGSSRFFGEGRINVLRSRLCNRHD